MRGQEFLTRLREEVLIGDGAVGTMISEYDVGRETNCERLNLTHPNLIEGLHAAYVAAGADVIESNTFGANRTKLGLAVLATSAPSIVPVLPWHVPWRLAGLTSAGSVGPLAERSGPHAEHTPPTDDQVRDLFREQIVALADAGADLLMLETFTELPQLLLALEVAKKHTDLPVVCQMAFHERGHTYGGVHASTAVEALTQAGADVVGANCGRGVRCVMAAIEAMTPGRDTLVSAFPNAGLPAYVDGR